MASLVNALIVGGGPAGVAAAIILQRQGMAVTLVDQRQPGEFQVGEGLIPAGRRILTELGAPADWLEAKHLPSMGNASAWGSAELATMDFIRSVDGHGWHLDRAAFDADLRALAAQAGVQVLIGTRMHAFERDGAQWRVNLEQGDRRWQVQADWLLDATGRPHVVARRLGQKRMHLDAQLGFYQLFAPQVAGDADALSLIEAVPEGWWYSARLPSGQRIVVFFTDAGTAAATQAQDRMGYLQLLMETRHLADRLAQYCYVPVGSPQATDARSGRLAACHGDGWLALGDAAMAFDPLSSQGIYTAMYAGLKAGAALGAYCAGDGAALAGYQQAMDAVWEAYALHWRHFYQAEQR